MAAESGDAFAHAGQTGTVRPLGAAPVVADFESDLFKGGGGPDGGAVGVGVAHHVGDGFPQRQRQDRLLLGGQDGQVDGGVDVDVGCRQCSSCVGQFRA